MWKTFWQPDPDDALDQWSVQLDLGRPVLARQIRLVFPDREGARPLRQFSVFVASGARIQALNDVFKFEAVYRTSKPNTATELVIPLEYLRTDSTYVLDEGLALDLEREQRFQVIQYIIIEIDEHSLGVGLAEVEVLAVGDNVSLGTAGRGGSFSRRRSDHGRGPDVRWRYGQLRAVDQCRGGLAGRPGCGGEWIWGRCSFSTSFSFISAS